MVSISYGMCYGSPPGPTDFMAQSCLPKRCVTAYDSPPPPPPLPSALGCGSNLTLEHALACKKKEDWCFYVTTKWHQLCAQVLMSCVVSDEHHKNCHANQFVPRSLTMIMTMTEALSLLLSLWLFLLPNKRILHH